MSDAARPHPATPADTRPGAPEGTPANAPSRQPLVAAPVWRRPLRLAAWGGGALLGLLLALVLGLSLFDWNHARGAIGQRVAEATGRPFEIRGDLGLRWRWEDATARGPARWLPAPEISARDVWLGNPPGLDGQTAQAAEVRARIALLPLLARQIALRSLSLDAPVLSLQRDAQGRDNWSFGRGDPDAPPSTWTVDIASLVIGAGQLSLRDAPRQLQIEARIDSLAPVDPAKDPGPYRLGFRFEGRYGKAVVEGSGQAGNLLSLQGTDVRFPLQLQARAGQVQARAEGILNNPAALSGLDFDLELKAPSMAMLYPLTGLVLPSTPPFRTAGRLVGSLTPRSATWGYRDFTGSVGGSDLAGSLTYTSRAPRPLLSGEVRSKQLRLQDLAPVVGAGPAAKTVAEVPGEEKAVARRPGKVLPDEPLAIGRWNQMDVDVGLTAGRIVRDAALTLTALDTRIGLRDGVLQLKPLNFGLADGRIEAALSLDSTATPVQATLDARLQALKLARLFPTTELMEKSIGRIDGALALKASGTSPARLLGSSSGQVKLYARHGRLSKELLDLVALNLGSVAVTRLFGSQREVNLRCALADVPLHNGLAQMRNVKVSTDEAQIEVTGTVNLASEQLDLHIKPESLGLKLLSLRTPLYARGSFEKPDVGLEKGPLLLRAGGMLALAAAAPVALAVLPVTVPGAEDDIACKALLAAKRQPSP